MGILMGYGNNQYKIANPTNHKTSQVQDAYILENDYMPPNQQGQELDLETHNSDSKIDVNIGNKTVDQEENESDQYTKFMNQVSGYANEDIALLAIIEPTTF